MAIQMGIGGRKTDTGSMRVSSPALTALDLIRYPQASGGLDRAASVLNELAPEIDPVQLRELLPAFERSVVQRLGYVLQTAGHEASASVLSDYLSSQSLPWIELDPGETSRPEWAGEPERDQRWHVVVRRPIEIDEQ